MKKDHLFIPATVEEREIELADGSKQPMHFRHLPNTTFELYFLMMASKDMGLAAKASVTLLAAGVCDPDGTDALTVDEATRIRRPIAQRMLAALFDVNGYGKDAAEKQGKQGNA